MLMGSVGGEGRDPDFRGMYTAVLWAGSSMLSAALVRAFGPALAEIPLIATRPEAQVWPVKNILLHLLIIYIATSVDGSIS